MPLVAHSRHARFVIENLGEGAAHDVGLQREPEEGKTCPLVRSDYDKQLPIPVLRGGGRVELIAALCQGTGVVFDISRRWREEGGKIQERQERISRTQA